MHRILMINELTKEETIFNGLSGLALMDWSVPSSRENVKFYLQIPRITLDDSWYSIYEVMLTRIVEESK